MLPRDVALGAVVQTVQYFFEALEDDVLPMECIERFFGISKPNPSDESSNHLDFPGNVKMPIGRAVFGAYITFKNHGILNKDAMIGALLDNRMPSYFQWLIKQTWDGHTLSFYTLAFHNQGYDHIDWELFPQMPVSNVGKPFFLPEGTRVVLDGLSSKQGRALNKKEGKVVGQDDTRYHIRLDGVQDVKRCKPENVFQVPQQWHPSTTVQ